MSPWSLEMSKWNLKWKSCPMDINVYLPPNHSGDSRWYTRENANDKASIFDAKNVIIWRKRWHRHGGSSGKWGVGCSSSTSVNDKGCQWQGYHPPHNGENQHTVQGQVCQVGVCLQGLCKSDCYVLSKNITCKKINWNKHFFLWQISKKKKSRKNQPSIHVGNER